MVLGALFFAFVMVMPAQAVSPLDQVLQFGEGERPKPAIGPSFDLCVHHVDEVFKQVNVEISDYLRESSTPEGVVYEALYEEGRSGSVEYLTMLSKRSYLDSLETAAVRACEIRGAMSESDIDLLGVYAESGVRDFKQAMNAYVDSLSF